VGRAVGLLNVNGLGIIGFVRGASCGSLFGFGQKWSAKLGWVGTDFGYEGLGSLGSSVVTGHSLRRGGCCEMKGLVGQLGCVGVGEVLAGFKARAWLGSYTCCVG
jgi:hypothetical protein